MRVCDECSRVLATWRMGEHVNAAWGAALATSSLGMVLFAWRQVAALGRHETKAVFSVANYPRTCSWARRALLGRPGAMAVWTGAYADAHGNLFENQLGGGFTASTSWMPLKLSVTLAQALVTGAFASSTPAASLAVAFALQLLLWGFVANVAPFIDQVRQVCSHVALALNVSAIVVAHMGGSTTLVIVLKALATAVGASASIFSHLRRGTAAAQKAREAEVQACKDMKPTMADEGGDANGITDAWQLVEWGDLADEDGHGAWRGEGQATPEEESILATMSLFDRARADSLLDANVPLDTTNDAARMSPPSQAQSRSSQVQVWNPLALRGEAEPARGAATSAGADAGGKGAYQLEVVLARAILSGVDGSLATDQMAAWASGVDGGDATAHAGAVLELVASLESVAELGGDGAWHEALAGLEAATAGVRALADAPAPCADMLEAARMAVGALLASVEAPCAAAGVFAGRGVGEGGTGNSLADAQDALRAALAAARGHLRRVRFRSEAERAEAARQRVLAEREEAQAKLRSLRRGLVASSRSAAERPRGLTLEM